MTSVDDEETFTIQLEDSRDVTMHFEMDKIDNFDAVFRQYSKMRDYSLDSLEFKYKGNLIHIVNDTPISLKMCNEDNIVHVSLTGIERTKEILADACVRGVNSLACELLSQNRELITQIVRWVDREGQEMSTPPLFIAIDYSNAELVTMLLPIYNTTMENDNIIVDTMRAGCGGYTAIEWACWVGSLDTVQVLVEEGGVKISEDAMGIARDEGHNLVVEYLEQQPIDWYACLQPNELDDIMEKACREGDLDKVKSLVEDKNYDLDKWKDNDNDDGGKCISLAPMYSAVRNGHVELIQFFGEKGLQL